MEFDPFVTGIAFPEAPRVDDDGALYFSDVMLGGIWKRSANGDLATFLPERRWIGGIALNADGAIICSGRGGLWYFNERTAESRPLLAEIEGAPINQVNDIQPDGSGGLYFGTIDGRSLEAGQTPGPGALFRLDPDGRVRKLWDDVPMSNGLGLSPDGKTLYHARTFEGLFAYDIQGDGTLLGARLLAPLPDCDGLAVDAEGGIWVAACRSGEIRRHLPNGAVERIARLPVKEVLSLTFGGPDLRDLYVATAYPGAIEVASTEIHRTGAIYRGRCDIPGQRLARTRF